MSDPGRSSPSPTVEIPASGFRDEKKEVDDSNATADIVVDFDGPNDPLNPRNWNKKKKWTATLVVSAFTFISPISSSMIAPASSQVADSFGVHNDVVIGMFTSIFVLAYAIGPLFLGPLSEIYGRNRIIQGANVWYLAWNTGCAWAQNTGQLLAFRFLAGLGGSAPLAVGGAVIGDIWEAEERGQALAIYALAPLLGPVVGPLAGAFVAEDSTWRWVFWSSSIADVAILALGVLYLRETYPPYLLEKKTNQIRKSLDAEKGPVRNVRSNLANEDRTWSRVIRIALTRPFILLYKEPIIQVLSLYMAYIYGLYYLFLTSMPLMFQGVYGESVGISGLHYLALGVGVLVAAQILGSLTDSVYNKLKAKNNGVTRPEYRVPLLIPGAIALPVGLFITGWTVQAKVHWIVPDIGIALVGGSIILSFQAIQLIVVDMFAFYAASALACVSFLRSIFGFGFPLFAQQMYRKLGYGKGDTILAVIAIVIGCPAPWLLWAYGPQLRARSKFAKQPT
ncbi:MFS polyamine transporter [Favolaschia claudopus]|uniref:MFS polyamine transporter n=1 Tax=Favolaschia claudopus TaxID=2862362 RepID=A0AAW0B8L5_9AGAR